MTFADTLRQGGSGPEIPWHNHDASDISGRGDFLELKVDRLLGGTILGEEIILNGADSILRSSNFVSGSAGWQILGDGSAELNDITVRGTIFATAGAFEDVITLAKGGSLRGTDEGSTINHLEFAAHSVTGETSINFMTPTGLIKAFIAYDDGKGGWPSDGLTLYSDDAATPVQIGGLGDVSVAVDSTKQITLATGAGNAAVTVSSSSVEINNKPLLVADGSVAIPAISFATDPDTGIYLRAVGEIGFAVAGNPSLHLDVDELKSGFGSTGQPLIRLNAGGNASFPDYSFIGDTDTGMYRGGANDLRFATGGGEKLRIDSGGVTVSASLTTHSLFPLGAGNYFIEMGRDDGVAWTPYIDFHTGDATADFNARIIASGGGAGNGDADMTLNAAQVQLPDGSATKPGISFINDTNTGLFRQGIDAVSLAAGGSERLRATTGSIFVFGTLDLQQNILTAVNEVRVQNGSATDPSYTFSNDQDTGMYMSSTANLEFAVAGGREMLLTTSVFQVPNVYNSTTASAANVYVSSTGWLQRSTSLEDWKEEIEPWQPDGSIYDLLPIMFYPMVGNPARGVPMERCSDKKLLGLGARKTGSVSKFFVTEDEEGIDWNAVTAATVAEMQVLRRELDELKELVNN